MSAAEGLQRFGQREITREIILEPPEGKSIAHYVIIPNLELDGKRLDQVRNAKRAGRSFWLRIFSSNPVDIVELKRTYECIMRGELNESTSGGCRFNERGFDNPL